MPGNQIFATQKTPDRTQAKQALERVLASRVFAKAERSRRFLRYLVEAALAQPPIAVKEYTIALDVFDRDKSYDPSIDATVRVEASRLRARLRDYYLDEGRDDDFAIEVPKGSYAAVLISRARSKAVSPAIPPNKPGQENAEGPVAEASPGMGTGTENAPQPESVHSRKKVWRIAALAGLAAICLLIVGVALHANRWRGRFFGKTATAGIETIAVLPLDNLSGDPSQEYFADGMTEELIAMLAKNSTLRVVSRTSVMQYKGVHRPIRDIARELGADGILEGSVAHSGNQLHMTLQLIQAPTDTHLWAESYDRTANDAVSLSSEASIAVAKRLNRAVPHLAADRYVSPEAHDAYLRGRYLWFTGRGDEESLPFFKKATELQPDYAQGWAGLANYYGFGVARGILDPRKALPALEAGAIKAVSLDDSLPEGHLAMAAAFFLNRWDWPRAEAEINRAIELDPKFTDAYHFRARLFAATNRHQDAIAAQKKGMEIDPFERTWAVAQSLDEARQYDAALENLRKWGWNQGEGWLSGDIYRRKGALKEAVQEWEKASLLSGDKESAESIRRAFEKGGFRAVILRRLRELKQRSAEHYVSPGDLALVYALLGQREETLGFLEQAYRDHCPGLLWIQNDPAFDFLHSDERYRSIIRGVGLPPAW